MCPRGQGRPRRLHLCYLCEFERGTGARENYPSLDQMIGEDQKFSGIFRPKSKIQIVFLAENR